MELKGRTFYQTRLNTLSSMNVENAYDSDLLQQFALLACYLPRINPSTFESQ